MEIYAEVNTHSTEHNVYVWQDEPGGPIKYEAYRIYVNITETIFFFGEIDCDTKEITEYSAFWENDWSSWHDIQEMDNPEEIENYEPPDETPIVRELTDAARFFARFFPVGATGYDDAAEKLQGVLDREVGIDDSLFD